MTDEERIRFGQLETQTQENKDRISKLQDEVYELRRNQEAIHTIAASVEVIAQRMSNIEGKVDETNRKIDAQALKIDSQASKIADVENQSLKEKADRSDRFRNTVITAAITAATTLVVSGAIYAVIAYIK